MEDSMTQRSLSRHPLPLGPSRASGPQEPRGWRHRRPSATHWKCRSSPSLVPFRRSCSWKGRALCTEQETSRGLRRWPWILGGMLTRGAPGGKDLPSEALPAALATPGDTEPRRGEPGAARRGSNPRPHHPGGCREPVASPLQVFMSVKWGSIAAPTSSCCREERVRGGVWIAPGCMAGAGA